MLNGRAMRFNYWWIGVCFVLAAQAEPLNLRITSTFCSPLTIPSWTHLNGKPIKLRWYEPMSHFRYRRIEGAPPAQFLLRNSFDYSPSVGMDWQFKEIWKVDASRPRTIEPANKAQWDAAREIPGNWITNRITSAAVTPFLYRGRTFAPPSGYQWGQYAGDPSPSRTWIVTMVIKIPNTKPEKYERYEAYRRGDKGTIGWIFHRVDTGEEVSRVIADFKAAEPGGLVGDGQWVSDSLYVIPTDRNGLKPLLCDFSSK